MWDPSIGPVISRALISQNEIAAGLLLWPVQQCVNSVLGDELCAVSVEDIPCHLHMLERFTQSPRPGPTLELPLVGSVE